MMSFKKTVQRTIDHIDLCTDGGMDPYGCHLVPGDFFVDDECFLYCILDNKYTPIDDEPLSDYIDRVFIEVNKHYNP